MSARVLGGVLVFVVVACESSGGTTSTDSSDDGSTGGGTAEPTTSGSTGETAGPPRFTPDVWPILQSNCLRCHTTAAGEMTPGPMSQPSGLALGADDPAVAYAALVDQPSVFAPALTLVVPGDPESSYLLHKVTGTQAAVGGMGSSMPPGAPLADDDVATIEAWIDGGALE